MDKKKQDSEWENVCHYLISTLTYKYEHANVKLAKKCLKDVTEKVVQPRYWKEQIKEIQKCIVKCKKEKIPNSADEMISANTMLVFLTCKDKLRDCGLRRNIHVIDKTLSIVSMYRDQEALSGELTFVKQLRNDIKALGGYARMVPTLEDAHKEIIALKHAPEEVYNTFKALLVHLGEFGESKYKNMDWASIQTRMKRTHHPVKAVSILSEMTQIEKQDINEDRVQEASKILHRANVIPGISDHDAVLVDTNTSARIKLQKPRKIHLYNKADWDGLRLHMSNLHDSLARSKNYSNKSVEELWQTISSSIEEGVNTFIPSKWSSSKNKLPWIKVNLKRLYRKRDKAYKQYKGHNSNKSRDKYLSIKHLCRKETKLAYQNYLEDILNINNNISEEHEQTQTRPNTKKLYSLLKHSKQDSFGIDSLKKHNKLYTSDQDKATVLNEQFQSVFTSKSPVSLKFLADMKVQDQADTGREVPHTSFSPHNPMCDIDISVKGVEKLLKNLNPHKAAGPDQIRPIVLKNTSKELAPIVSKLFQKSLQSSTLPDIWKMANVAPVFKKGSKSDPANYRPISLTCILCKTLEHIVSSSITKHFTRSNLFYELQHGFREKKVMSIPTINAYR
ncbi:uncharacterized protein LOC132760373 [Ruditapes philippinarum]|uniref:uncharacterized protein LOC132760373 n=1 Tax=Ruditapes philippinarum TaxID=129788 RepID=UPI00295BC4B6|nr:uncharacterized protein LOC132760373 [Ruditapes philippinarum]